MKNKPDILLLSDLWGKENSDWMDLYLQPLSEYFKITYYDCSELAEVDKSIYTEEHLHKQFVKGGIENAVENLLNKENKFFTIVGFSIGGLIAWKACLSQLSTNNLYAISSTRLRYETIKPSTNIELFYGVDDQHKPSEEWFNQLNTLCCVASAWLISISLHKGALTSIFIFLSDQRRVELRL